MLDSKLREELNEIKELTVRSRKATERVSSISSINFICIMLMLVASSFSGSVRYNILKDEVKILQNSVDKLVSSGYNVAVPTETTAKE